MTNKDREGKREKRKEKREKRKESTEKYEIASAEIKQEHSQ